MSAKNMLVQYYSQSFLYSLQPLLSPSSACPLRKTCIGKSNFKKIVDTVDKHLYDQMHERLQTRKARRMKKLRQATVEPVIGTLINFLGMRRVNTRGIGLANKCLLMAAVCYNLKRLLKWMGEDFQNQRKSLAQLLSVLWLLLAPHEGKRRLPVAVSR
jgi:hypothetical protein